MTHDDLGRSLAAHLKATGDWLVWTDMQLGAAGSPRPDVYALAKTYSRLDARVYEVKVSRSDFLADVTSGKYQSYLKFATCVIFAVPAGLVTKKEVPERCGLIEYAATGSWRHTRRPILSPMPELPRTAWLKLVMDGVEREGAPLRLRHFTNWAAQQKLAKKFGDEVAQLVHNTLNLESTYQFRRDMLEAELTARRKSVEDAKAKMQESLNAERSSARGDLAELEQFLGLSTPANHWAFSERIRAIRGAIEGRPLREAADRLRAALRLLDDVSAMAPEAPHQTACPADAG